MTKTKTLFAGAALTAMLMGGVALAQPQPGKMRGPDANQDGIVTQAEVRAHAKTMFARMDVTKDGKLDKADREARQAERFKALDTDGSGEVSLAEMTAAREARQAKRAERQAKRGPNTRPQPGEAGQAGEAGRGGPGPRMARGQRGGKGANMRQAMMRMDSNKDGAITLAEFEAGAMARFTREDTNQDGQVTQAERDAVQGDKRGNRPQRGPGRPTYREPSPQG